MAHPKHPQPVHRIALALLFVLGLAVAACGNDLSVVATDDPSVPTTDVTETPAEGPDVDPELIDADEGAEDPTATPAVPDEPPPTPTPEVAKGDSAALEAAIETWTALGVKNYAFTYEQTCECLARPIVRVRVPVSAEPSVSASNVDPSFIWTIPALFEEIARTISDGKSVVVTYDKITGIPTSVQLDLEALHVDGGMHLEIRDFAAYDGVVKSLETARQQWRQSEITDYDMTYSQICFCPENMTTSFIRDGRAIGSRAGGSEVSETGGAPPPGDTAYAVEDIFAQIDAALDDGPAQIEAEFDPEFGYPLSYYTDMDTRIADEEHGINVLDLTIVIR